jgi:hypothetical protein
MAKTSGKHQWTPTRLSNKGDKIVHNTPCNTCGGVRPVQQINTNTPIKQTSIEQQLAQLQNDGQG